MQINRILQIFVVMQLAIWTTNVASAAVMWQPTAVSTTMGELGVPTFSLGHLISNAGLTTPYVSGVTDASTYSSTHTDVFDEWISTTPTGFVSFDLGSDQQVNGFRYWSSSWFVNGSPDSVRKFELFADSDFDPTNGLGASLGTFTAADTGHPETMQSFTFATTSTRFVQMQVLTNSGAEVSGFAEGAFTVEASSVPEPATLCIWGGLGLVSFVAARRRKSR